MGHQFTPEQVEFLKENVVGITSNVLTEMFNSHFKIDLKASQIRSCLKRNNLKNGLNTQFKKGDVPFNKGKKGIGGHKPTQFKKGMRPPNARPIGAERIDRDGYTLVKVAEPSVWRPKSRVVWEEVNGPIPDRHAIIFADGNLRNFDIDNLILVTRGQLATLNKLDLIKDSADLTRVGIVIADLHQKIGERKKAEKGKRKRI